MDLSVLSLAELKQLALDIPGEIKNREEQDRKKVLDELKTLAEVRGFSLEQLIGKAPKGRAVKPVAVKYQHPGNRDLTWTGRGRKPKWVESWLEQGKTLEELAV